jgi:hypothetical protein
MSKQKNFKRRLILGIGSWWNSRRSMMHCVWTPRRSPPRGDEGEVKKLQLKVRDLEAEREIERGKYQEQENEFKRRIGNL